VVQVVVFTPSEREGAGKHSKIALSL